MTRYIPLLFVLLWSTGFIGAKFGLPYAEPFTMLGWRMLFVVPLFLLLALLLRRPALNRRDAGIQCLVGLLIHGAYLGGVFAAIDIGVPAGLSALIVSLNPLLIAALSGWVLGRPTRGLEWLALTLGLAGVAIVLIGASSWEGVVTAAGLGWLLFALSGICTGTLLQKRYAEHVDLFSGSFWQYLAALGFFLLMAWGTETREVEWSLTFVLTLGWLFCVLSMVTVLLLLYMIRHGEATRVSSYFYLVPPLAAFQGWLFFDEPWSWSTLTGAALVIVSLLVYQSAQKVRA